MGDERVYHVRVELAPALLGDEPQRLFVGTGSFVDAVGGDGVLGIGHRHDSGLDGSERLASQARVTLDGLVLLGAQRL